MGGSKNCMNVNPAKDAKKNNLYCPLASGQFFIDFYFLRTSHPFSFALWQASIPAWHCIRRPSVRAILTATMKLAGIVQLKVNIQLIFEKTDKNICKNY